jgi:hypothetical protein
MKPSVCSSVFALMALLAVPASAQQAARPERPYRGLFASGDTTREQQLSLNASLGGGYDDNIVADALQHTNRGGPNSAGPDGFLGNAGLGLTYSLNLERLKLDASGHGGVRYYPSLESSGSNQYVSSESGQIAGSLRLTDGTSLSASATTTHRPQNLESLLSPLTALRVDAETNDLDLPTTFDYYRRYGGSAELRQQLSRQLTFHANYGQRWSETPDGPGFTSKRAGAGLMAGVGRGLALRAGYQYSEGGYLHSDGRRVENHNIDAGIDYSRALSFSRRTTLSFSTGSSVVEHEGHRRYRATGAANLAHEIGRTWTASLAYFRGVRILETWDAPLFSDVMTASLGGLINRRIQVASSAGGSMRQLGLDRSHRGFTSYWGATNISIALNRHLNFGVNYLYTQHRFDTDVPLPTLWPQRGERQRVTAHIGVWMPLLSQTRRADVTR